MLRPYSLAAHVTLKVIVNSAVMLGDPNIELRSWGHLSPFKATGAADTDHQQEPGSPRVSHLGHCSARH